MSDMNNDLNKIRTHFETIRNSNVELSRILENMDQCFSAAVTLHQSGYEDMSKGALRKLVVDSEYLSKKLTTLLKDARTQSQSSGSSASS